MNRGVLFGVIAYLMWGFFPAYFKALHDVPATQIISHRIVWSALFLALVLTLRKEWGRMTPVIRSWRVLLIFTVSGLLLGANWLIYVWGINAGFVVETSLGYFINPLLSVLLGVVFLRERLRPLQWAPIGMAALGVAYITISYHALPWIALGLAATFGLYGLIKKLAPLDSLYSLTAETVILFIPALIYLGMMERGGQGAFGHIGLIGSLLLAFAGVVTAIPLLLFGSAARQIPLSILGILQYIAPTCQFLLGVLAYGEEFSTGRVIGFSIIWLALMMFTMEGLWQRRKLSAQPV